MSILTYLLVLIFLLSPYLTVGERCGIPENSNLNCVIWDKSYVKTFQGELLRFDSECSYDIIRFEDKDGSLVNVKLQNETFCITKGDHNNASYIYPIPKNEKDMNLLHTPGLIGDATLIHQDGRLVTVRFDDIGLKIIWDTRNFIEVVIENNKQYPFEGLCSKDCANDKKTFVDRWSQPSGCTMQEQRTCSRISLLKSSRVCEKLFKDNVFEKCQKTVYTEPFIDTCISTYCNCKLSKKEDCLCELMRAYSNTCEAQTGEALDGWTRKQFCRRDDAEEINKLGSLNRPKRQQQRSDAKITLEAIRDGATMFGVTTGLATAAAPNPFTGVAAALSGAVAGITGVIAANIQ